jgi:hypothetical protein
MLDFEIQAQNHLSAGFASNHILANRIGRGAHGRILR